MIKSDSQCPNRWLINEKDRSEVVINIIQGKQKSSPFSKAVNSLDFVFDLQ